MRISFRTPVALLAVAVLGSSLLPAGAIAQEGGGLTGWLHLSSRMLSLSGSAEKYSEEYDYQKGFQLAGLMFQGNLGSQEFGLNASGWGESPTATLGGWFEKSGLYRLNFGGYNSRYYHTTGSYVDEYGLEATPYAYTRRGRYADLALTIGTLPDIHIRYDRFRREGYNTLVWNIEREKHLAFTPVDETSSSIQVATTLPISITSVDLSYTLYSLDNRYGAVVPDTSSGLDGRTGILYDYSHIIHDEGNLPVLKANIAAPVGPALFHLGYSSSSGTVDKSLNELEEGIDYQGSAVDTAISLNGSLDRNFSIIDAGVSISLLKGLSTDISMRRTGYEVAGVWDPTGSADDVETSVTTTRYMGRVVWNPLKGVTVDLGGANITRTFEEEGVEESETVTSDWVGGLTYSRQEWFTLRFSHRVGDIESPYTRIAPTDRNIQSTTLNLMPFDWLTATFAYRSGSATRYYSHDSSDPEYYFNTRTSDIRNFTVGVRINDFPLLENLDGFMTYTRGRMEMTIPIATFSPPSPPIYDYRDITHAMQGGASYELKEGVNLVTEAYWYKARGQWPLSRMMRRLGIVIDLNVLTLHVDYRQFALNQVAGDRDDFDASLFTIGFSRGF